jgi:acetyltransferase
MPAAHAFGEMGRVEAGELVKAVRREGRTLLDEVESKTLLARYDIPTVPTVVAATADDAAGEAKQMGFPVVVKLYSRTITHKTDVGGVKLNLQSGEDVRRAFEEIRRSVRDKHGEAAFQGVTVQPMIRLSDAYELIIGSSIDPQFGPVLLFGTGGQLVEVFKDRALALPPLNATLARRMMEQTKIFTALKGVRGRKAVDVGALEQILVRFSQLVVEQRWIKEIDINPLLASGERLIALDARVVLHEAGIAEAELPRPAVRPYPVQYVAAAKLKDGTAVTIRPIRPEDEPLMVKFHQTLSERSVRLRYFHPLKLGQRVAHERLIRVTFNDYDREIALIAERREGREGPEILGVGRLSKTHGAHEAEFAILISDAWQGRGLGTELLKRLLQIARDEGLDRVTASILPDNLEMQRVCEKLGFRLERMMDEALVKAEIGLR